MTLGVSLVAQDLPYNNLSMYVILNNFHATKINFLDAMICDLGRGNEGK